ncbi:MAG: hypothetical protein GXP25_15855 [Planctomycetes bacterium]|nr:hypothetical protein [Planctomycetota bacterium]
MNRPRLWMLIPVFLTGMLRAQDRPINLLGSADGTSPSHWGACVRIPPDTGEFLVRDRTMTLTRKRPGGDFKIYRVFGGIEPGVEYTLSFQIKVDAKTPASVGVLDGLDGRQWSWNAKPVIFEPTGEWRQATIRFKGRPDCPKGCLQLYPPKDMGGSVSFGLLSIWPVQKSMAAEGSEEVYPCHRLKQAPVVDGKLDENAWRLLPEVSGFAPLARAQNADDGLQVMPDGVEIKAARREFVTTALSFFQAGYTDKALYVAVRCYQPRAERLPASDKNKADIWRDDCVEIHVVPGEKQPKTQFIVNAAGAQWPAEGWTVKTVRRRDSWLVEAEIPLALLQKTPKPGDSWPINISRHATTPRDTLSTWAPNVANFHDVAHYRRFAFQADEPSPDKKLAEEAALNRSFREAGEKPADEASKAAANRVRTHVFIYTRNVDAALFVNGQRVPLKARVWPTSYAGFLERTLSAVADTREGENVVAVIARASGPEPGIRIQASRAATDAGWKCAPAQGGDWLKPGFDDSKWTTVEPGESRRDNFYWPGKGDQLIFRQVIRGVEKCSQDVRYTVHDWKRKGLGRHRAIVRVEKGRDRIGGTADAAYSTARYSARIVWAHIPWRRRDVHPEKKGIRIVDAKTGKFVTNMVVLSCKQEYGDIAFEPPTVPGDYEIYYLPYVELRWCPRRWGMTDPYLKPFEDPDPNWLTRAAGIIGDQGVSRYKIGDLSRGNWQRLPRAELVEIQAKTEFDRVDPMEIIAAKEEIGNLLAATADRSYLVFPEDRKHPVRMFETIPLRWIKRGPTAEFTGKAQPDEYYCYQLGVFATNASINGLELELGDLRNAAGKTIPASAMTCFNLTGIDWLGKPFEKVFRVDAGLVRPLWIGVQVPKDAAGDYTGTVTVKPKGLPPTAVKVTLTVSGDPIANHGDDDPVRHTRLRWLNSTLGIDDDWLVPPYTPLEAEGNRISCLDRTVEFGPLGLPTRITSRGNDVLAAPMTFHATREGKALDWEPVGEPKTVLEKKGRIVREYVAESAGVRLTNTMTMEFDGCVHFELTLSADKPVSLTNVGLDVPYNRAVAEYMAGADGPGGYRVPEKDWAFQAHSRSNGNVWLGNVNAGMQLRACEGTGKLREEGDAVRVSATAGNIDLVPGKERKLVYRLLITPFKPINKNHWRTRVGDPFAKTDGARATIMHIHHANAANPWINYPFLYTDKLQDLQKRIVAQGGLGVQLYYTVRELTTRCVELWALRSLGSEVFSGADKCYRAGTPLDQGTGFPWLREHLVAGYHKAWRTGSPYDTDAAISQRFLSRWHNYYVEGLNYLLREKCFYSLYLDGIGYDRDIMKRVARVMSRWNPNYRMEHHQCTNPTGTNSVINMNLEHMPYVTELWYGESFNYNKPPDYWLVDISGLCFGVTGEMLDNTGTINMWRGMIYGLTGRIKGREYIWKLWDDFGIADAEMLGYWNAKCPVKTDSKDVLATVYRKKGKSLIALATWSRKAETVKLQIDWQALGLDPKTVRLRAPEIKGLQKPREFRVGEALTIPPAGGWMLIAESAT